MYYSIVVLCVLCCTCASTFPSFLPSALSLFIHLATGRFPETSVRAVSSRRGRRRTWGGCAPATSFIQILWSVLLTHVGCDWGKHLAQIGLNTKSRLPVGVGLIQFSLSSNSSALYCADPDDSDTELELEPNRFIWPIKISCYEPFTDKSGYGSSMARRKQCWKDVHYMLHKKDKC